MYACLGVDETATQEQIEAAYRQKVRKVHPDMGGTAEAFCALQEAYRALTDPTLPMRKPQEMHQEETKTLVLRRPDGRIETQHLWLRAQDGDCRILTTSQWSGTAADPEKRASGPGSHCGRGSAAAPDVVLGNWSPLPTE